MSVQSNSQLSGWLDTALSVAGTIGKIAGMLQGDRNAVVRFGAVLDATGEKVSYQDVVFAANPSGGISAMNTSADTAVQLFFPSGTGILGTAITIPAFSKFDVTKALHDYAAGSINQFQITPANVSPSSVRDNGPSNGGQNANIQAQGQNIPPNQNVPLGPYVQVNINATITDRSIIVTVLGGLALVGVVLLNIRGAGDTFIKIVNVFKGTKITGIGLGDDASITVQIPSGIDLTNGAQVVDLIVAVSQDSYASMMKAYIEENVHLISPLTDADLALIKKA